MKFVFVRDEMVIKEEYKQKIIEEFKSISKDIKEANTVQEKLYYYTATYGTLNRILNINYDPELLFINFILERCFEGLDITIKRSMSSEIIPPIPDLTILMEKIGDEIGKLADALENNKSYTHILVRIVELVYTTTGNGAYLYHRGIIKI